MSWNNVKGVSSAQIWTHNPDMTHAYLFANGNHQVKLTIGISLTLNEATQPGPTEDEVKTALSLINFETGAGLSFLKTGNKGGYAYVYQPNTPEKVKSIEATSNSSAYQYEFDYYVSSDSTLNANYASEIVALMLSYIDASGNKIEYYTASGSKSQSYVTVTVYPPKKYGTENSNMTLIRLILKDDKLKPQAESYDPNTYSVNLDSAEFETHSLRIDDPYFRLIAISDQSDVTSDYGYYRDGTHENVDAASTQGYFMHDYYLPTGNNLNQGSISFSAHLYVNLNSSANIFSFTVDVHQEPNEIILVSYSGHVEFINGNFENNHNTFLFTALDQFGNPINIDLGADADGPKINSIN